MPLEVHIWLFLRCALVILADIILALAIYHLAIFADRQFKCWARRERALAHASQCLVAVLLAGAIIITAKAYEAWRHPAFTTLYSPILVPTGLVLEIIGLYVWKGRRKRPS